MPNFRQLQQLDTAPQRPKNRSKKKQRERLFRAIEAEQGRHAGATPRSRELLEAVLRLLKRTKAPQYGALGSRR